MKPKSILLHVNRLTVRVRNLLRRMTGMRKWQLGLSALASWLLSGCAVVPPGPLPDEGFHPYYGPYYGGYGPYYGGDFVFGRIRHGGYYGGHHFAGSGFGSHGVPGVPHGGGFHGPGGSGAPRGGPPGGHGGGHGH